MRVVGFLDSDFYALGLLSYVEDIILTYCTLRGSMQLRPVFNVQQLIIYGVWRRVCDLVGGANRRPSINRMSARDLVLSSLLSRC